MVKKPSKVADLQTDPESQQKKHLKTLAVTNGLLSRHRPTAANHLAPSAAVHKLDGRDIVKRGGQRKTRFLFSFPGLIGNLSGGRIGELADLGSKNPVLYLEFPNGRMKLFGTHVYPKNKYLTLQLTRSTKGVQCEDCFESLIVFSDAWWIGSKEENPEEQKLEFPEDITESKPVDAEFKGGAGVTFEESSSIKKPIKEVKENKGRPPSPVTETDDDMDEDSYSLIEKSSKNVLETTPARQSARMAGKTINFAASFGNDSTDSEDEKPDINDQIDAETDTDNAFKRSLLCELDNSVPTTSSFEDDKNIEQILSLTKSNKSNEDLPNKNGKLVQATVSTLFAKALEKSTYDEDISIGLKDSANKRCKSVTPRKNQAKGSTKKKFPPARKKSGTKTVSVRRPLKVDSEDELDEISSESQVKGSTKQGSSSSRKRSGTRTASVRKQSQVVSEDESDEISSEPQDDDSDEDWDA